MKVLLSRLHEFLPSKPSADDVSKALSQSGIEVAECVYLGKRFEHVIVAQVKSFKKHPQADRLRLCDVFTGTESLQIVCGASNFKEGDRVCLAQVGAYLPNDLKIKASLIRGEASAGMLCSESELKLSEASEGILILPEDAPLGMTLIEYFQLDDYVFTLEITPNRGDCLSVVGIAR